MAITASAFAGYERIGADRYRIKLTLTRNDGPATEEWFTVQGLTLAVIRDDLRNQLAARVESENARDVLAGIAVGTAIPITRPTVTPTVPTAKQLWLAEHARLQGLSRDASLSGAAQTALAAAWATHNGAYVAGYLDA